MRAGFVGRMGPPPGGTDDTDNKVDPNAWTDDAGNAMTDDSGQPIIFTP